MRFPLILISFLFALQSFSQGQGLLWKVERKDLVRPSYLFGTIHLISSDKFTLPNELLKVAKEAKKHVFEADISDIDFGMMQKLLLPNGKSISDFCSESDYTKIESYFVDTLEMSKMEFAMMSKMQPIFLTQTLTSDPSSLTNNSMKSYEIHRILWNFMKSRFVLCRSVGRCGLSAVAWVPHIYIYTHKC